jgi:hypothetical protein
VIVQSTVLPLAERKAARRARWAWWLQHLTTACVPVSLICPVLALWLLVRLETGWAVTLLCLTGVAAWGACARLSDVGPKETP